MKCSDFQISVCLRVLLAFFVEFAVNVFLTTVPSLNELKDNSGVVVQVREDDAVL